MKEVFVISPTFVRESSNLSNNIQDKFLQTAIRETTEIDFQNVVGTKMLKKIKDLILSGDINKDEYVKYSEMLNIAKYFLLYSVIKRIIPVANVKLDNIGVNFTSDANVQTGSINEMFRIQSYYEKQADYFEKILQDFCRQNYAMLPELSCTQYGPVQSHLNSSANCPIFLGGARGKHSYKYTKICNC